MECEIYRIFKTCKRPFMGAFSVCMTVPLKKITKICSSLTWRQSKKCKVCVRIPKMNVFAATFEKQPCKNVSKINSSWEAAIKMHFSISLSAPGEIILRYSVKKRLIFLWKKRFTVYPSLNDY